MHQDLVELLPALVEVSARAGRGIARLSPEESQPRQKADRTPVTDADLLSHHLLQEALPQLEDIPLISEEAPLPGWDQRRRWKRLWMIDPLDGTREYLAGKPHYSVNIAMIENGESVLGVVHLPASGVTYTAVKGHGAQRRLNGQNQPLRSQRPARQPPTVAVGPHGPGKRLQALLDRMGDHELLRLGGAVKACVVAEGRADLYPSFGPTAEWDTAAAQCILQEAGGALIDLNNQPLQYNRPGDLKNPAFLAAGDPTHDWSRYAV